MFDLREEQERVILVGVQENGGANAEESLDELAELFFYNFPDTFQAKAVIFCILLGCTNIFYFLYIL